MRETYCFNCSNFVEILDNDELECGHTKADQQTVYEYLVGEIDNSLKEIFKKNRIPIEDKKRRELAFHTTIDVLGKWYEEKFVELK